MSAGFHDSHDVINTSEIDLRARSTFPYAESILTTNRTRETSPFLEAQEEPARRVTIQ